MSSVSQHSFNGVRARFQRLTDNRFFVGWVQSFYANQIVVRGSTDSILSPGDNFYFEIHGLNAMATFTARLTSFDELDVLKNANFQFVQGADTQVISVAELDFEFEITSQVRYARPVEEFRLMVNKMTAQFQCKGNNHDVTVTDISTGGLGLVSEGGFEVGDTGEVAIFSEFGVIRSEVEVRYSIRDPKSLTAYRNGVKILNMARIDVAKWNSLLTNSSF
ncbi:MAG: PilZ domain-containing protein [Fimbriimonadaceae bacterium]|nr:PilZ domain-containing protein [Fimbriimonadaceae bacterium]